MPQDRTRGLGEYFSDEDGAVTVDWVVLTAAIVGLGMAMMAVVSGGVESLSTDTATELAAIDADDRPFGEPSFDGLTLTGGTLTSWHHNQAWFDGTTAWYSDEASWSEAGLASQHQAMADIILANNPADRASGHYQNAIDHMGAVEIGMQSRGIDIPDSGMTYTQAYNDYHG